MPPWRRSPLPLEEQAETIIAENAADLIAGRQAGLSEAVLDRLTLTEERISGHCQKRA